MAEFPQNVAIQTSEVARRLGRDLSTLSPVRASLIRKGMIYSPEYGGIAYTVPMFADYMKRMLPA
jgi:hypothetical protein